MLTQDRVRELLDYNPETGAFFWKKTNSNRATVGTVVKRICRDGYLRIGIDNQRYLAHRIAFLWMTGSLPTQEIDHINQIRHDNSWKNLREAVRAENSRNITKYSSNTSGCTGVSFDARRGFWRAYIKGGDKQIWLGYFKKFEDAVSARIKAEQKMWGQFAPMRGVA